MALRRLLITLALSLSLGACAAADEDDPTSASEALNVGSVSLSDDDAVAETRRGDCAIKTGDLIFHRSQSEQAAAIAYLTKSELTHVGVVFKIGDSWNVYEAIGPVKVTSLGTWIGRGQGSRFATSRYKTDLTADQAKALFDAGKPFYGKPYDLLFERGDDKIYCSELALKMYEHARTSWLDLLWSSQFSRLWERADHLDGWADFQADLARPGETSGERLVKRIMAARGVDEQELAAQVLVAPVTLSNERESGGVFREVCGLGSH